MFALITDGGSDFEPSDIEALGLVVVPFYISFDKQTFLKEGVDISKALFFERLVFDKHLFPKTAQPSPQDYVEACEPFVTQGQAVVVVTISSQISGSHNSASLAKDLLLETYPQAEIHVIDSLNGSLGQRLIVKELAAMRTAGYTAQRAVALSHKVLATTRLYIALDTLDYLKRGGRISATAAALGNVLGLRPLLHAQDGRIVPLEKVRGKKRMAIALLDRAIADMRQSPVPVSIGIGHIFNEAAAQKLKANLEAWLDTTIDTPITQVGAALGAHAGPGALLVAYCQGYEVFEV